MLRINKTKKNLQNVWEDLDKSYECLERALGKIGHMTGLNSYTIDLSDRIELSYISSLKEQIELELEKNKVN